MHGYVRAPSDAANTIYVSKHAVNYLPAERAFAVVSEDTRCADFTQRVTTPKYHRAASGY